MRYIIYPVIIAIFLAIFGSIFYFNYLTELRNLITSSIIIVHQTPIVKEELEEEPENEVLIREISFFTSTPEQADSSPCISASGVDICLGYLEFETFCATNEFPFGTILWIGGGVASNCTVVDRTNSRYNNRIDYYFGFDEQCLNGYQPGDDCPQMRKAKVWGLIEAPISIQGCDTEILGSKCDPELNRAN